MKRKFNEEKKRESNTTKLAGKLAALDPLYRELGGLGEENYNKLKHSQEHTTPLRQAGTPEQMAEAAIFFLTSASNITGEFLIVDAGTHLGGLPMKGR